MPLLRRSHDDPDDRKDEEQSELARRVLAHSGTPEEKLERLLAERTRELEEQAARFQQALADLERREQMLRDMRASVDRMLHLGATDLTARESVIEEVSREVEERQTRLLADEAELARRRSELGAVELKREAIEHRERAVAAREARLAAAGAEAGAEAEQQDPSVSLLFVPGSTYRLVEIERRELAAGSQVEVDGSTYVVSRLGRAPLPGDRRTCAYLERAFEAPSGSDKSP
jgi:hypothetical protein